MDIWVGVAVRSEVELTSWLWSWSIFNSHHEAYLSYVPVSWLVLGSWDSNGLVAVILGRG